MTTRTARTLAVLLGILLAAGCGGSRKAGPPKEPETGRPLPSEAPENIPQPGAPEAIPPPGQGQAPESGKRYGYRVQVAAYTERARAEERAAQLRRLFEESVHVVHEGLLYKVQVGDFVHKDRAEALRRKAVDLGLEGAFVVDTLIEAD